MVVGGERGLSQSPSASRDRRNFEIALRRINYVQQPSWRLGDGVGEIGIFQTIRKAVRPAGRGQHHVTAFTADVDARALQKSFSIAEWTVSFPRKQDMASSTRRNVGSCWRRIPTPRLQINPVSHAVWFAGVFRDVRIDGKNSCRRSHRAPDHGVWPLLPPSYYSVDVGRRILNPW